MTRGSLIGIAGVPAVGKKTVGSILAQRLECRHATVLELASESNMVLEYDELNSEYVIDVDSMRRLLEARPPPGICVLSGVLVPSVLPRSRTSLAVVLRASPEILYPRYLERGYSGDKVRDNLLAEALGVAVDEAIRAYGEDLVHEVNATGRDPVSIASEIVDVASGSRSPSILRLDWLDVCERVGHLRSLCFPELPPDLDRYPGRDRGNNTTSYPELRWEGGAPSTKMARSVVLGRGDDRVIGRGSRPLRGRAGLGCGAIPAPSDIDLTVGELT